MLRPMGKFWDWVFKVSFVIPFIFVYLKDFIYDFSKWINLYLGALHS